MTSQLMDKLSAGTSMDVAWTAEKSLLFNHCNAQWNKETAEIYQPIDGITQHSGGADSGMKKMLVVFCCIARRLATSTFNTVAVAMGSFKLQASQMHFTMPRQANSRESPSRCLTTKSKNNFDK